MKLKDLDFKKLGLTNKREEYVAKHYRESYFKGMPNNMARKSFIKQLNEKGYVPLNIELIPEREHFKSDTSVEKVRYGVVYAPCIYFGKRNAPKIKTLEADNNTIFLNDQPTNT